MIAITCHIPCLFSRAPFVTPKKLDSARGEVFFFCYYFVVKKMRKRWFERILTMKQETNAFSIFSRLFCLENASNNFFFRRDNKELLYCKWNVDRMRWQSLRERESREVITDDDGSEWNEKNRRILCRFKISVFTPFKLLHTKKNEKKTLYDEISFTSLPSHSEMLRKKTSSSSSSWWEMLKVEITNATITFNRFWILLKSKSLFLDD